VFFGFLSQPVLNDFGDSIDISMTANRCLQVDFHWVMQAQMDFTVGG
jgi:hypothetical protein